MLVYDKLYALWFSYYTSGGAPKEIVKVIRPGKASNFNSQSATLAFLRANYDLIINDEHVWISKAEAR
jgi:hypothetical protein